jgi:hypothetical protein
MRLREQLSLGAVLVWRSIRVVAVNPLLLVYPVASFAAGVGAIVALGAVFGGRSLLPTLAGGDAGLAYWLGVADVAVALLGGAVLTTLFNVALVHVAIRSLRKEDPRLRDGLYKSLRMLDRVVVWGVVSSTVGPVAEAVERVDPSGRLVDALLGGPWSSAGFLVAPVVAFEDPRLTRLFERSRQLYRKSWGYTEGASLGVDLVLALAAVPLLVVGWYARTAALGAVTAELLTAVAVVGLLALGLLRQTAVGVSKAAVYIHATTNRTPTAYTGVDLSTVSWGRTARED